MNFGWNLTIFVWMTDVSLGQVRLGFGDLDLVFKFGLTCQINSKKGVFAGSHEPLIGIFTQTCITICL